MPVPVLLAVVLLPADVGEEGLLINLHSTGLLLLLLPPPLPPPLSLSIAASVPRTVAAVFLFPLLRAAMDTSLLIAADARDSMFISFSSC